MWAGRIERERGGGVGVGGKAKGTEVNPYEGLEARVGFWDVRVSVCFCFVCCEGD